MSTKFVTHFGSYTMVLKPDGDKPIYNHKGCPIRVEGTVYCEFKAVKGSSVGMYETDDPKIIKCLQEHPKFNKSFRELKTEADFKSLSQPADRQPVKLPKSALMACNKGELKDVASQYNVTVVDEDTKNTIVDKIIEAQKSFVPAKEERVEVNQVEVEGGIKQIMQEPRLS